MQPRASQPNPIGALRTGLLLLTLFVAGCSSGAMEVDPPSATGEELEAMDWPTASSRTQAIGCSDDDVRLCSYYLPAHNGVRPCIVGYQVCSDNMWSRCTEGLYPDGGAAPQAAEPSAAPQTDPAAAPQADAGAPSHP
jgi:hypothetical protein